MTRGAARRGPGDPVQPSEESASSRGPNGTTFTSLVAGFQSDSASTVKLHALSSLTSLLTDFTVLSAKAMPVLPKRGPGEVAVEMSTVPLFIGVPGSTRVIRQVLQGA